jgi:hypothetical protein
MGPDGYRRDVVNSFAILSDAEVEGRPEIEEINKWLIFTVGIAGLDFRI